MSLIARRELHASIRERYQNSIWIDKRKLLDGFVAATGYERKYRRGGGLNTYGYALQNSLSVINIQKLPGKIGINIEDVLFNSLKYS